MVHDLKLKTKVHAIIKALVAKANTHEEINSLIK